MKLLDIYITREFLKFLGITCLVFIGLYLIGDFFERIRFFLTNRATFLQMASYFLYSIPMIISLTLPAAILLATLLTYSSLSKYSEITAMKANGISLYRIGVPVIAIAAIVSVFLFFFSEMVAPFYTQKATHIVKVELRKHKKRGFFKQNEIWYRSQHAIYNFKIFDIEKNTLRGITINQLNPDFTLKARIDAEGAQWKDNHWIFFNLMETTLNQDKEPSLMWAKEKVIPLPEQPDDFKIIQQDAEKMGYFDLRKYVHKIQSEGYDVSRYLVDLHGKVAFPFVCMILVVIGMSFSFRSERSGGVMQSIGVGIMIGFSYFIVYAFCMSLGRSGTLPALLAAWTSNILFGGLAVFLLYRVRT